MIDACRLCGSDDLVLWMRDGRNRDLNFYRCRNCTLWNYDLDCGVDQNQYTETYVSPDDKNHKFNQDILQSWHFLRRQVKKPASIMDIGCGSAGLLYLARKEGWDVHGMELTRKAARNIFEDQGIEVIVANFLEYENPEKLEYDVVVLRHVLEHLPDSLLAMRQIGRLLRPNGVALLEFPNTGSISYSIKRVLKNLGLRNKKLTSDWRPGHVNEFCRTSFDYLLSQTGFELVTWRTYSNRQALNVLYRVFPVASKARVLVRKK
jgi:2-polyprenyl-3-methyl-5-hydroxy-6-metoxy-1,4-benzoquinol methylase